MIYTVPLTNNPHPSPLNPSLGSSFPPQPKKTRSRRKEAKIGDRRKPERNKKRKTKSLTLPHDASFPSPLDAPDRPSPGPTA
jgi:hypothetical protein